MKKLSTLILISLPLSGFAQTDTFVVHFDLGQSILNDAAIRSLDSLTYHGKLIRHKNLSIIGYTDHIGNDNANMQLSQARANTVKEYLLSSGFVAGDIKVVEGRGEVKTGANSGSEEQPNDRKVEIVVGGGSSVSFSKDTSKKRIRFKPQVFDLTKSAVNTTIRLNNLLFHGGSYEPLSVSMPVLENLHKFMADNPKVKIRLEGHVCCTNIRLRPADEMNDEYMMLSTERAKTVYNYLVSHGIDKRRLSYVGFAGKRPLVHPELTEADEMINRRVEIRILEK